MDRLESMSMLLAAVRTGSLSAAARELDVPVATLSRKVADLETLIGARLLTRTTRKLALTDAGAAYAAAARRILDQVAEAEREATGEFTSPRGELVITAPVLFGHLCVLPVISEFLALFPDINVRLLQGDRYADLVEDNIDMAVRFGALADSAMIATAIGVMRYVVCASPALLSRHGAPQAPEDLLGLPCVSTDGPMLAPAWRFRDPGGGAMDVPVVPRLRVSAAISAVEAAMSGVGFVRLLHYQAAEGLANGALQVVLEAFEPEPEPIHLVHTARGQMPLKTRRFLDFAASRLRQSLAPAASTSSDGAPSPSRFLER